MKDLYKNLTKNYEENVDYKEVDQNDDLVKNFRFTYSLTGKVANGTKFYLITGECLKGLLMSAQTMKGKVVRKIYIKTEKLVFIMLEVIKEQQIQLKDQELTIKDQEIQLKIEQLRISESKNIQLISKIQHDKVHKIDGWIYLATTKQYALNNHFRLGQTIDLQRRSAGYKPGRTEGDPLYYVFVYKSENIIMLEKIIRDLLKPYREDPHVDMYVLHWDLLHPFIQWICDMFHQGCIPKLNKLIIDNLAIESPPVSPPKLEINDAIMTENTNLVLANGKTIQPVYYQ
jgi:phage anti-repressor protein